MRILTVSAAERSAANIVSLINEAGMSSAVSLSASSARRRILDEEWDTVVINYPLSDESGLELAHMAVSETGTSVVMLMRPETVEELSERLFSDGIIPVEKPVLKAVFRSSLMLAGYLKRIREENLEKTAALERKLSDAKIIGKAKCELALSEGLTEEEAHKRIERTAMDRRISLRDAALQIIRMAGR